MPELKLNYTVPITAYEGLTIKINDDGSFDMIFFQKTDESGNPVLANVVAAVHVPDRKRWNQMKELVEQQLDQVAKLEK